MLVQVHAPIILLGVVARQAAADAAAAAVLEQVRVVVGLGLALTLSPNLGCEGEVVTRAK